MHSQIATVCISGTLEQKLRACAAAGFDGIELFEADLVASPLEPEDVRAMAGDLGLSLDLYQPFRDFEGVDDDRPEENLRRARAKFTVMERLGIDLLLVCSNAGMATTGDDEVAVAKTSGGGWRCALGAHRLRGTGLGKARQHLRARLAARP